MPSHAIPACPPSVYESKAFEGQGDSLLKKKEYISCVFRHFSYTFVALKIGNV